MSGISPERRARLGLGYAPEGRRVFPGMTVRENLEVAAFAAKPNASKGFSAPSRSFRSLPSAMLNWRGNCRAASSKCSRSAAR